jgi:hypothetical protein
VSLSTSAARALRRRRPPTPTPRRRRRTRQRRFRCGRRACETRPLKVARPPVQPCRAPPPPRPPPPSRPPPPPPPPRPPPPGSRDPCRSPLEIMEMPPPRCTTMLPVPSRPLRRRPLRRPSARRPVRPHAQSAPLAGPQLGSCSCAPSGHAPAPPQGTLLRLLRACLPALGSRQALPAQGRPAGRPATASAARAIGAQRWEASSCRSRAAGAKRSGASGCGAP